MYKKKIKGKKLIKGNQKVLCTPKWYQLKLQALLQKTNPQLL